MISAKLCRKLIEAITVKKSSNKVNIVLRNFIGGKSTSTSDETTQSFRIPEKSAQQKRYKGDGIYAFKFLGREDFDRTINWISNAFVTIQEIRAFTV